MKLNKKGVSLVALVLTIVVILVIAAISFNIGFDVVDDTHRTAFMADLETLIRQLETYNIRAVIYNNLDGEYDEELLTWDGESPRLEHTAKMENPNFEDTPEYIFSDTVNSSNVKGKLLVIKGKLYVKRSYPEFFEWASKDVYKYMREDGLNP